MPRPKNDPEMALILGNKVSKKGKGKMPDPPKTKQKPAENKPKTRVIPPPIFLGDTAKGVWKSELPKLNIHPAKLTLFAGYCAHLGRAIDFEKEIKKKGTGKKNSNDTSSKHMEVNAAAKEWKCAIELATKLGITGLMAEPVDKDDTTTISKPAATEAVDEEDEFILGGPRPTP